MMIKTKETKYTSRARSDKDVRSRQSNRENQNILYFERLHQPINELVQEGDFKVLSGNAVLANRMKNQRPGIAFCFLFISVIASIPENRS